MEESRDLGARLSQLRKIQRHQCCVHCARLLALSSINQLKLGNSTQLKVGTESLRLSDLQSQLWTYICQTYLIGSEEIPVQLGKTTLLLKTVQIPVPDEYQVFSVLLNTEICTNWQIKNNQTKNSLKESKKKNLSWGYHMQSEFTAPSVVKKELRGDWGNFPYQILRIPHRWRVREKQVAATECFSEGSAAQPQEVPILHVGICRGHLKNLYNRITWTSPSSSLSLIIPTVCSNHTRCMLS